MKIAIGCDHGGFDLKTSLVAELSKLGYEIVDCGTNSKESVDYPDFAAILGEKVSKNQVNFGILICTTGEGISISANKIKGVRCGIGYNDDVALMMRKHNDANVIAFGAKYTTLDEALTRVKIFLSTEFEGGRHARRVEKINNL